MSKSSRRRLVDCWLCSELHNAVSEEKLGSLFITSAPPPSLSAPSLLLAPLGGDEPLQLGPHTNFHRYQVATINRFWNQVSCDLQFFPLTTKSLAPLRSCRGPQMSSFSTVTYSILLPADQETICAAWMSPASSARRWPSRGSRQQTDDIGQKWRS